MPPSIKENDAIASPSEASNREQIPGRQQTVALEVAVTVNGARPLEGSDKREPFSESTKTVLVHANGAVIRLSSAVAPGQLLFLTNERTKKEVVCQVVKSKSHSEMSGYVELQFTEPVSGFWGMRFPGERSAIPSSTATSIATSPTYSPAALSIEPELEPLSAAPTPAELAKAPQVLEAKREASQFTGLVGPQADAEATFKAELKADERSSTKADFLAPDSATETLKIETSRVQEQFAPMTFSDPPKSDEKSVTPNHQEFAGAAAKLLEMTQEDSVSAKSGQQISPLDAPAKIAPLVPETSLAVEELKIPAWLEPSARNAAATTPKEIEHKEAVRNSEKKQEPETADALATPPVPETRPAKPVAPVFSKTLLNHTGREPRVSSRRGGKGIWLVVVTAGIVLAAAGAAWYLRQPTGTSATNRFSSAALPIAAASTAEAPASSPSSVAQPQAENAAPIEVPADAKTPARTASEISATSSSPNTQIQAQPAVLSEHIAKSSTNNVAEAMPTPAQPSETEPVSSRPSIGEVRLAKPKVNRSARAQGNGLPEPGLEMTGDQNLPTDNSLGSGLIGEGAKQPAAPPLPVGGDVTPARMISSVPPVYPPMARTQHISGDVRIDALIDANGGVSWMKVVSGPALLHHAAMDALRQWKYQPATLDGKPVPMHLTVTIQFHLQ